MKILYSYLYCNLGGVSSVIRERIRADEDSQIEVTGCFSQDAGGGDQMRELGADVYLDKDYISRTLKLIEEYDYDSVHLIDEAQYIPQIRKHYPGKLILEMHTSTPRYLDQVNDEVVQQVDYVIVPSEWSRQQLLNRIMSQELCDRVVVLRNIAMSTDAHQAEKVGTSGLIQDGAPYLLWVGKLSGGKNWQDALRIYREIKSKIYCRLIMVTGGGIDREQHADYVSELIALGIDGDVDWRHNISRTTMSELYSGVAKSKGALLCTSLAESFGLVLIESLSHGLPVFSSNTHALPELINPSQNGYFFPVGNTSEVVKLLEQYFSGSIHFDPEIIKNTVPSDCKPDVHFRKFMKIIERNLDYNLNSKKINCTKVFTNYKKRKIALS